MTSTEIWPSIVTLPLSVQGSFYFNYASHFEEGGGHFGILQLSNL